MTAALLAWSPISALRAESLSDVLRDAHQASPLLAAEVERLQVTGLSVPRAQAGFLPTVTAAANFDVQQSPGWSTPPATSYQRAGGWSVSLEQPIYDGGAALGAVRKAAANVRAGRATLRMVESDVLIAAIAAYTDVLRARTTLRLQIGNEKALQAILATTREGHAVGDLTNADVAQSEAALAGARVRSTAARAALSKADADFLQAVHRAPGDLNPVPTGRLQLPASLPRAIELANLRHPAIAVARHHEAAGRQAIDVATAKLLPSVSLQASYQNVTYLGGQTMPGELQSGATVQVVAHVPLFDGGAGYIDINVARYNHVAEVYDVAQARAVVRTAVVQAWADWKQAQEARGWLDAETSANQRVLRNIREERAVGQRTIADVLRAESDLLNSRIRVEQAKRNATLSEYIVLASIGGLDLTSAIALPARSAGRRRALHEELASDNANWSTSVHAAAPRGMTH